jgi:hypothetical protein
MVELLLDLNIELLKGCKFSCRGCAVEKESQEGWKSPEDARRIVEMVREFKSRGYKLNFLNITPTDYMSAENTLEVLADPSVIELAHLFKSWFLQTTLLEPLNDHQKEIAKVINSEYKGTRLSHYLIFNPNKIDDQQYMEGMVTRKNRLLSLYPEVDCHRQFALYNWFEFSPKVEAAHQSYVERTEWFRKHFNANHDYNLSFARKPDLQSVRAEFAKGIGWLNELISKRVVLDSDMDRDDINFFMPDRLEQNSYFSTEAYDFLNRRYTYRNGEFYWVPFLIACLVNFDDGLRIPIQDWTVNEFERCEQDLITQQYAQLPRQCEGCQHIGKCAERQILQTLNLLKHDGCIAPVIQYEGQYKEWGA